MPSAYPSTPTKVLAFRYECALHLTREIAAVRGRRGEDADYVVAADYKSSVTVTARDNGDHITVPICVPEGFLTDLSSVPRWGRWAVSRVGPHLEASIVHDWLYVAWQDEDGTEATEDRRRFADDVFRQAMKEAKVGDFRTWLIYKAVRLGGRKAFHDRNHPLFRGNSA